ncbi:MAG: vanadium-dependent haloperoxidase [Saprospiraceae bacterium]
MVVKNNTYQLRTSKLFWSSILLLFILTGVFFFDKYNSERRKNSKTNQLVLDWNEFFLEADRFSEGYRSPITARTFGYIGLAAYEAALPGLSTGMKSAAEVLPGFTSLSYPSSKEFNIQVSLNACYKELFDKFYLTAPESIIQKASQIFNQWNENHIDKLAPAVYNASMEYGFNIANIVYDYSTTDTVGNQAYLHIYEKHYRPDTGQGCWKISEDFPMPPLLPSWGKVRTFIINVNDFIAKHLPEYSLSPNSLFYTEALEVLTISSPLSFENRWIAEFWSDDHPGLTFTPSGRWIAITNQVIEKQMPVIEKTMETYLKVGFVLADAGIACWNSKYLYNLERPEQYIHKVFDKNWQPHFHTPPFPSYPSGHSIFGAAVAEILTQLYGSNYEMLDNCHKGRDEFMSNPRPFHSFYEMAFENGFSRISLGVHFRMDVQEGLRLGFLVGKKICLIDLRKDGFTYQ